ncbi:MAG: preprotein translocase subunit SecA [Bacteroidales bacterium]|jgi:preprotein translocase subunit SecA|nr:preprotein translocase subunit SecA [Bacteroidales bacterium]
MSSIIEKIFGSKEERDLKQLRPILAKVLDSYKRIDLLSDDQLRAETVRLKELISERIGESSNRRRECRSKLGDLSISTEEKEKLAVEADKLEEKIDSEVEDALNEILPDAFAIMKSTARRFFENKTIKVKATDFDRHLASTKDFVKIEGDYAIWSNSWQAGGNQITWDMVHYDVQLIGGIVLHEGKIAEMATGEGKTLVATLPVFLNALSGRGVHVITVNDYLSRRDSEWMGPLYEFHGLSVECLDNTEPGSEERKKAYRADITFGTNNEFGFDYLRDNMAISVEELVQRKHNYAIVDEVDSVLIDDARTPLIISGPVPKGDDQQFNEYRPYVEKLYNLQKTLVNQLLNDSRKLLSEGKDEEGGLLLYRAYKGLPKYKPLIKFLSETGIKQKMLSTEKFYMQDNNKQMYKVTDPLYFVVEEKQNSVEFTDKGNDTIAGYVDDPKFFVLPDVGSEIAEIEKSEIADDDKLAKKDELIGDYAVKAERVHTVIQLLKAYTMFTKEVEYVVLDNQVKIVDEQTGRILEGRRYSDGLHQAIEAKENVKVEAATQTFATITLQNYFRMYHKLAGMTGTAITEAGEFWSIYKLDVVTIPTNRPVIRNDFDDLIYKTKNDKYKAVIEKINEYRKKGRPVLVGTTSVEVSELLSRMLNMSGIKHSVLNAKQHAREAEIVAGAGQKSVVTIATNMAGRGTDIKLGPGVREAGGLAIIGTERHESRRVDRQLRGRAGRQGDPGSSIFFVSLEDNLLRLFGAERISRVVDHLGMKEGENLQSSMLSKSIERAQRKVEENNFGIRKRLLEYDDIMNSQRKSIYALRKDALYGERIEVDLKNMISDFSFFFSKENKQMSFEDFSFELLKEALIQPTFNEDFYLDSSEEQVSEKIENDISELINRKVENIETTSFPLVKRVYETQGSVYKNIVIPVNDGSKELNITVNLEKAVNTGGKEIDRDIKKSVALYTIDNYWKEHLREMDELKQSVQNAAYEQKDPVLVYKLEAYNLFETLRKNICRDSVQFLVRSQLPLMPGERELKVREQQNRRETDMSKMRTGRTEVGADSRTSVPDAPRGEKSNMPVHVGKKVGRNDPCPCGSGKKYKNCCGKGLV